MNHKQSTLSGKGLFSSTGWKVAGAASVVAFFVIMIIITVLKPKGAFESPLLLAYLNTIFLGLIPLSIAFLATNSYKVTGVFAFLLSGCGLVFFGASSLFAGWVMPLAGNPNPTVTLHNLGCLFAGLFQLTGAHFFIQELAGSPLVKRRLKHYWLMYAGIIVLVTVTAVLAFLGDFPVFFDPITGPSLLRQIVLVGAAFLFASSGMVFIGIYYSRKTEFAYWYGLALLLISVGLLCVLQQPGVGSILGWTGRGAQYLGCVFFIFAFMRGQQELPAVKATGKTKVAGALWPYLEEKVRERTLELVQLNDTLQKEITERKMAEEKLTALNLEL